MIYLYFRNLCLGLLELGTTDVSFLKKIYKVLSYLKNSKETQLKVSAIAALGEYGNRNDLAVINPYSKSSDVRLRTAAVTAIPKHIK